MKALHPAGARGAATSAARAWRLSFAALALAAAGLAQAANFTIQNMDSAGEGFNDPAPFTPIGGNNATTLGQARLNVFNKAAQLWGALINSNVTINVSAQFNPLTCAVSSGTLGSAGPTWIYRDFGGAPAPGVFYAAALANALHGSRIANTAANGTVDIDATFNSSINGDPNCLGNGYLYLGFDHQLVGQGDGRMYVADLLGVVLHELGHGLGFISLVDQNGKGQVDSAGSHLSAFDQFVYDEGRSAFWKDLSEAQRAASEVGAAPNGNMLLAFSGLLVNAQAAHESAGLTPLNHVRLYAPSTWDASSSVSHWDSSAYPNLLMEPRYTLTTGSHADLTTCVMYDMGWTGSRCPDLLQATAQSVTVTSGTPLAITLAAANDNAAALSYSITTQPAHGTLGAVSGNSVTYTAAAGYTGSDSFAFDVADALSTSDAAMVSITVQAASGGGTGTGGTGTGGTGGAGSGATTPASPGGGGGGSMDAIALLALCAALATRVLPLVRRWPVRLRATARRPAARP